MKTRAITLTGVFTALIFIMTFAIQIPISFTNGYIHPGDGVIFLAATLLDSKYAIFAAASGSMLADVAGGYYHWAIPTLIIKGLMAFTFSKVSKNVHHNKVMIPLTIITTTIWGGFLLIIRRIMSYEVNKNPINLLNDLEDIDSVNQLMNLHSKVQNQILIAAIIVPILIILMLVFINKKIRIKQPLSITIGIVLASLIMIIGYYFTAYLLYGNYITPIFSIPSNIIQFIFGYVLFTVLYYPLTKLFNTMKEKRS